MQKKALLSLIALLCVMLALAACGNGKSNDQNNASSSSPAASEASSPSAQTDNSGGDNAATANDKEFTIRVGAWFLDDRPHEQALKKAVEDGYKKLYPNAKIQWDVTLGGAYFDKLKAQFASDSAPDVTFFQQTDWFKAGNFMDLSNEPWVARLTEAGKKEPTVTYQGKLYGVPMEGSPSPGVWYNTELFNELGLKPPTTVQEFMDVCEKIKAAGKTPIALGFKDVWTVQMFLVSWIQSYGFVNDPDFGKKVYEGQTKLDDPTIQAVYQNFQTMKEKGYFNKNALSIDWPASAQLFASGDSAMIMQGPWMPGANKDNIQKGGFKSFQIGYFPLMDDKGNVGMTLGNGAGLAINAKTKLVEESKALVNLMTTQDVIAPWLAGDGALPFFSDVQVAFDDPVMETVKSFVDKGVMSYAIQNVIPTSSMTALTDIVTKVVSGASFNPSDLKAAQDAFEKDKESVVLPY